MKFSFRLEIHGTHDEVDTPDKPPKTVGIIVRVRSRRDGDPEVVFVQWNALYGPAFCQVSPSVYTLQ